MTKTSRGPAAATDGSATSSGAGNVATAAAGCAGWASAPPPRDSSAATCADPPTAAGTSARSGLQTTHGWNPSSTACWYGTSSPAKPASSAHASTWYSG